MKRRRYFLALVLIAAAVIGSGCAAPISKEMLRDVDESATLDRVRADPAAYEGKLVLWTGIILDIHPQEKSTVVEVLERPADRQMRPRNVDATRGRFLARWSGFIDPAVFSRGREITVAGKISGIETSLIGEYKYTYPVVDVDEYHLWAPETESSSPSYPPYPFYHPWWF